MFCHQKTLNKIEKDTHNDINDTDNVECDKCDENDKCNECDDFDTQEIIEDIKKALNINEITFSDKMYGFLKPNSIEQYAELENKAIKIKNFGLYFN